MVGSQGTRGQQPTQHLDLRRMSLNRTSCITVPTFFTGTHDQPGPRRPGHPETWWRGRFLQSGQLPDGTERKQPCRADSQPTVTRTGWKSPRLLDRRPPKKKNPAFQFFRLKCDLFRPNSLKQSAVTRHTVPKNTVTSRATWVRKARSMCFRHSSYPTGGSAVGNRVPGKRGCRPLSAT